jgi:hypothetical protein
MGDNPINNDVVALRARIVELENANALGGNNNMDLNRPLREYTAPQADGIHLGYAVPNIRAEEF